jgi:phospholipid/cholesterol/gamma-HCH transport system substrate-binding protein
MPARRLRRLSAAALVLGTLALVSGCQWQGLNSLPLPGTAGRGPGSFQIQAQIADVTNIQRNSRVRVGDVTVGNVTNVQRQGWHALLTMRLDGDVNLPANATATVGQTSLLGSLHVELAPPTDVAPEGKLGDGASIPLKSSHAYPTTEQTLAAVSVLLNGGGLGQLQDVTQALTTAFANGRADDLRTLLGRINQFIGHLNTQTDDIIRAAENLNTLTGQFADQKPVLDRAFHTLPDAVQVLANERDHLVEALEKLGTFTAQAATTVSNSKKALIQELKDLGPVVESLANAGPALTRSLSLLSTFPFPKETLSNWMRGDYGNLSLLVDLTLTRLDSTFFTGTRWEGNLTELEMQWGRTIGQIPSPYTQVNPLVVPYHMWQGN